MRTVIGINKGLIITEADMMLGIHLIVERLATFDYSYAKAAYVFNTSLHLKDGPQASAAIDRVFKTRRFTKSELHQALVEAAIECFGYTSHYPHQELDLDVAELALTRIESLVLKQVARTDREWVHASST